MLSPKTQAILLLTAHFSGADDKGTRPLGIKEWATFAFWLHEQGLSPEHLLSGELSLMLKGWQHKQVTLDRLQRLLNRATALGLALEKWTRAGLWVLTRSDAAYPARLKKRLGNEAPPVLFGCGDQRLLRQGGIAVVGSRDASEQDLQRSNALGAGVAAAAVPLVSGGARGVDETAMLGALAAEGSAIGVLSCDLLKTATSNKYRRYLLQDSLVLLSPFYPEAGFNAGNAMQRNKYIYCLADTAIAVHSGIKGGTWEGALEVLKREWVPLWVLPTEDSASGNAALVSKGAKWLQGSLADLELKQLIAQERQSALADLLSAPAALSDQEVSGRVHSVEEEHSPYHAPIVEIEEVKIESSRQANMYDCFLMLVREHTSVTPLSAAQLEQVLQVHKTQLSLWLKQAIAEGKVQEMSRPKRYVWKIAVQDDLFLKEE